MNDAEPLTWPQRALLAFLLALLLGAVAAVAGSAYLASRHNQPPAEVRPVLRIDQA